MHLCELNLFQLLFRDSFSVLSVLSVSFRVFRVFRGYKAAPPNHGIHRKQRLFRVFSWPRSGLMPLAVGGAFRGAHGNVDNNTKLPRQR